MASLQAKHSRSCAAERPWTPFREATNGCTCPDGPVYYVVVREDGRADKIRVGRNRRQAERALRKIAVTVDDGEYQPQPNMPFAEWANRWLASLELKKTTVKSYAPTMSYAKSAFRRKPVRRLRRAGLGSAIWAPAAAAVNHPFPSRADAVIKRNESYEHRQLHGGRSHPQIVDLRGAMRERLRFWGTNGDG